MKPLSEREYEQSDDKHLGLYQLLLRREPLTAEDLKGPDSSVLKRLTFSASLTGDEDEVSSEDGDAPPPKKARVEGEDGATADEAAAEGTTEGAATTEREAGAAEVEAEAATTEREAAAAEVETAAARKEVAAAAAEQQPGQPEQPEEPGQKQPEQKLPEQKQPEQKGLPLAANAEVPRLTKCALSGVLLCGKCPGCKHECIWKDYINEDVLRLDHIDAALSMLHPCCYPSHRKPPSRKNKKTYAFTNQHRDCRMRIEVNFEKRKFVLKNPCLTPEGIEKWSGKGHKKTFPWTCKETVPFQFRECLKACCPCPKYFCNWSDGEDDEEE